MMGWTTFPIRKKVRKSWKAALSNIFWAIWKERNRVVFDNDIFSPNRLKQSFILSLTSWTSLIFEGELLYCKIAFVYPLVSIAFLVGW